MKTVALILASGIAVLAPPERFRHEFAGQTIAYALPLAQARALCATKGVWADACSWTARHGRECHIVFPVGRGALDSPAAYYWHEIAHCNGWSEKHEQ